LFFSLVSGIINIKMHKFFPVVVYGCETWSLTLKEERRRRVTENRVLRRILAEKYLVLEGTREQRSGEDYTTRNFTICTAHQMLFG